MTASASFLLFLALFVTPGVIWLRHAARDVVDRVVFGVATSCAASIPLIIAIGLLDGWTPVAALLLAAGLHVFAILRPVTHDLWQPSVPFPRYFLAVGAAVCGILSIQAMRPNLLHPYDAVALWGPLAEAIAKHGDFTPAFVPTMSQGISPGVALLAGPPSRLSGSLVIALAQVVHPIFTGLALVVAMMTGHVLAGGRRVAPLFALAIVLATPLLGRGMLFHDDLVNAFFVSAAFLAALRATRPLAWGTAGAFAAAALSIKYLGLIAVATVLVIAIARWPGRRSLVAAAAGIAFAAPWHVGNLVRLGDPVFPFGAAVFGLDPNKSLLLSHQEAFLDSRGLGKIAYVGGVALVLGAFGLVAGLWAMATRNADQRRTAVGLAGLIVAFLVVWNASNYGARHLLALWMVVAGIGALGFVTVLEGRARHESPSRLRRNHWMVAVAVLVIIVGRSVFNVGAEYYSNRFPAPVEETAIDSMIRGKWVRVQRVLDPPADPFASYGEISLIWSYLGTAESDGAILTFDPRRFYVPQRVISGDELAALDIYAAGTADDQRVALQLARVRYVLATPFDSDWGALHALGPWRYLQVREDLFELVATTKNFRLYRVKWLGEDTTG